MQRQLNDPTARRAMQASVAEVENAGLLDAYERTEDEIAEYERQLVLIDEGGKELASQQSVEKLIAELQKDRKILELVANLGSGLSGLGTGGMEIAGKASEKVTEELVGQVAGPLKAAKLIVQLSVNAVKAAERWRLWYKFRQDLQRATTAVSALSSTIQGFYNNKKEQIAFHTIEDALLAVQFAGAVVGSVPEPITLAVGKTMSAVASAAEAANKVVNLAYDEVMLRKAWATTKAAMDNPRDRSLGLEALKINPTLGMHAIAWAGLERQDPIARMVLDSCGLNEQTLADGGTTEKNVRQYLETLLDEDRSLMDPEKLQTDWQPKPLTLTAKDWVIVQGRATKVATPKLRANDTSSVIDALKKTDAHDLPGLNARIGTIDPGDLSRFAQETQDVVDALTRYQPKTDDGDVHEEMSGVLALFLKLANDHKLELARIADG
jgi:hypothetical protein